MPRRCLAGGVSDIDVRPEEINLCALKIRDAGESWGTDDVSLETAVVDVPDLFGGDELGAALAGVYDPVGPTAQTFTRETGFCLLETAVVLARVAAAYTEVEADNAQRSGAVDRALDRLGRI